MQVSLCLSLCCFCLFDYVHRQHVIAKICLQIPQLSQQIVHLQGENRRLWYVIERFENPEFLLRLSKLPEFSHLQYPQEEDIYVLFSESKN